MNKELSDHVNELGELTEKYLQTRVELLKLTMLGKLTKASSSLINSLIFAFVAILILLFALTSFVVWYGQTYGDYLTALLLTVGFLVLFFILFALFRNQITPSIVLRKYSSLLLSEDKKKEEL